MDMILLLVGIVVVLVAFDVAVGRWGVDSRKGRDERTWERARRRGMLGDKL